MLNRTNLKKPIAVMCLTACMVMATSNVFAREAMYTTADFREKAPVERTGIYIDWDSEAQSMEVHNIPYTEADYKVQISYEGEKYKTFKAEEVTNLPVNADGTYNIRIMKRLSGNSYENIYSEIKTVENCTPWLGTSEVVDMEESQEMLKSDIVQEILALEDPEAITKATYEYLTTNWTYNYERARTVKSWYTPNNNEVFVEQSGICYDYASVVAAILRTAGIPTKVIFGYAGGNYHAWNEVLLNDEWVMVDACWAQYGTSKVYRSTSLVY